MAWTRTTSATELIPNWPRRCSTALEIMEGLGAEIVEIQMPDVDKYLPAWPVLCSSEAVAAHRENYPSRRDDYGPWFRGWLDMGAGKSGADYAEANNMRAECNGLVREAFKGH